MSHVSMFKTTEKSGCVTYELWAKCAGVNLMAFQLIHPKLNKHALYKTLFVGTESFKTFHIRKGFTVATMLG